MIFSALVVYISGFLGIFNKGNCSNQMLIYSYANDLFKIGVNFQ